MSDLQQAKQIIADAKRLVVLTGAGVSAESGVPTFRDALTGLWENFDPTELATPEAFRKDRDLVWGWYEWRRKMLLEVEPNPAHFALAKLAQLVPEFTLITQNVDDLHERAGSKEVIHLHGSIFAPRCFACDRPYTFTGPLTLEKEEKQTPPKCEHCGGDVRPGVVWFGEMMPIKETEQAFAAAKNCDVFLSIGTSGVVYPAAGLPIEAARYGAKVIHINPGQKEFNDDNQIQIIGKAGEVLPQLL